MLRAAVLASVVIVLGLAGCGDDGSSADDRSTPATTPTATGTPRDEYYSAMGELLTRLDRAVAGAIAGEAEAVERIERVVRDVRKQLKKRRAAGEGASPAGNLVLTTAASARDYARTGDRQGLQLIRDVPIVEACDALETEAAGG
jgi:hypothetical protein